MAADPSLVVGCGFVSLARDAVEDAVVDHHRFEPPGAGRVGEVRVAVRVCEDAQAGPLGEVADAVGPARGREAVDEVRDLIRPGADLVSALGVLEVVVEVAVVARCPVEAPAHAVAVCEQLLERCAGDAEHGHVASLEVRQDAVEAVGD